MTDLPDTSTSRALPPSLATPSTLQTVVYILDVAEKPGIANAITAVFAHRGLSIEAVVADAGRRPPRILVVFTGTPRQCRMVEHVLQRLHDVYAVRCVDDDAAELRAVAFCRTSGALPALAGVEVRAAGDASLVSGSYRAVQAALARWSDDGLIVDVSRSLVAL